MSGLKNPLPAPATEGVLEPSLEVTQRLGPNLTAALTVNTDFAETEVDTRQTNLTRFPLFFPEKRTFFLQGADIFQFGAGLGEALVPFFTRRIGLVDGREVADPGRPQDDGSRGFDERRSARGADARGDGARPGRDPGRPAAAAERARPSRASACSRPSATRGAAAGAGSSARTSAIRHRTCAGTRTSSWGCGGSRRTVTTSREHASARPSASRSTTPTTSGTAALTTRRMGDGFDPAWASCHAGIHNFGAAEFDPRPQGQLVIRQCFNESRPDGGDRLRRRNGKVTASSPLR